MKVNSKGLKKGQNLLGLFIKKADCMMYHLAKYQAIFINEIEWKMGVIFSRDSKVVIGNTRLESRHDHLKYLPIIEDLENYHLYPNMMSIPCYLENVR